MAPSTLGTFLRSFTFERVRQLDRVLGQALARARRAGAGPGKARLAIHIDSFVAEVHGHAKQCAGYGHTGKLGYHPLLATARIPARSRTSASARARPTPRAGRCASSTLLARVRPGRADPPARGLGLSEPAGHGSYARRAAATRSAPRWERRSDLPGRDGLNRPHVVRSSADAWRSSAWRGSAGSGIQSGAVRADPS
jgi:hypothetical protein